MAEIDRIVSDIRERMTIRPGDIDLDAYADSDEAPHILPASEYEQAVWDHMHRPPEALGGLMPWAKTHGEVQIRPGELSVWAGKRGEGKSLLTSQVAIGLMTQGQRVIVASMEMPVCDTLERMERQALGVDQPTREYHREFYRWAGERLWLYEQGGVVAARRVLGLARYSIAELGAQHVILDSLMMIGLPGIRSQFDKLERQAEIIRDLAATARDTGAHIHLIAHLRKGDGGGRPADADDVKGGGDITDLASAVYLISANRDKLAERNLPQEARKHADEPDLWLRIEKNRRGIVGGNFALWLDTRSLQYRGAAGETARPMIDQCREWAAPGGEPAQDVPW